LQAGRYLGSLENLLKTLENLLKTPFTHAPASKPAKAPGVAIEQPSGLPLPEAVALVETASERIWTPEGANGLAYLHGRGLNDPTIRAARLGFKPEGWPSGIVIPWLDADQLTLVKIRRLGSFKGPKYIEVYRDRPRIYPGLEGIPPGKPLIIVEGEFDALLLGQELGELAAVITLGSASSKPEGSIYLAMLPAPVWYLAHDGDDAGDNAASGWPDRARRVRPPAKDWTEARQAGVELRRWWVENAFPLTGPFAGEEAAAIREFGPSACQRRLVPICT
jgi:hypothetical protein